MKLLIVDDEKRTRSGIIDIIQNSTLGITEIREADDGLNALALCEEWIPDIVISDVRMPRMDGISMLSALSNTYPGLVSILMSGYSDREYLKAAISLKSVAYIDKPIIARELNDALANAILQKENYLKQRTDQLFHNQLADNKLASYLTENYSVNSVEIESLTKRIFDSVGPACFDNIVCLITELKNTPIPSELVINAGKILADYLSPKSLFSVHCEKRDKYLVIFIYGETVITNSDIKAIAEALLPAISAFSPVHMAAGPLVHTVKDAFSSYNDAVILLQSCYFGPDNILINDGYLGNFTLRDINALMPLVEQFSAAITAKCANEAMDILDNLENTCYMCTGIMINQIRGIYMELMSLCAKERIENHLQPDFAISGSGNTMELLDKCFSYNELHKMLIEKVNDFFNDLTNLEPSNSIAELIREYIASHYQDSSLSVQDISSYLNRSSSYICTFFKKETGITLNQYLTEYRMEKAKQLLKNPRYKIGDISDAVGYSDGNYFAKSFRKYTGISPTEYREKA